MWEWIKENAREHPILWSFVGVLVLPTLVAVVAVWSICSIEEFLKLSGIDAKNFFSLAENNGKSDHRVNMLIGLGSVIGIIVPLIWRSHALQKQADAEHRRQVSEQFTQGMGLLAEVDGKDNPSKEARIGGLYSLESLADADPESYGVPVMKAVVAYIRENAQKTAGKMPEKTGSADTDEQRARPLGEDVKAAFAVLKKLYDEHADTHEKRKKIGLVRFFDDSSYADRLKWGGVRMPVRDDLDFSRADFDELDFRGVEWIDRPCCDRTNFQKANLWHVNLAGAHLEEAILQGTYALNIDMRGTNLWYAQLQGVNLRWAKLQGANLQRSRLQGVNLQWAKLQGADLQSAHLQGANLQWAELQGANLRQASLWLSMWSKAKIDTNVRDLKKMLTDAELSENKINEILDKFKKEGGSKGLWKSFYRSVCIFCDKDFAPLTYPNANIEEAGYNDEVLIYYDDDDDDFDDNEITWEEAWTKVFQKIPLRCRHHIVNSFIYECRVEWGLGLPLCFKSFFSVVEGLEDSQDIEGLLPEDNKRFIDNEACIVLKKR